MEGLAKQLDTAAKSVERLGTRTRAMTRTLRDVHDLPDAGTAAALLDMDGDSDALPDAADKAPRATGPTLLFSDTAA